MKCKNNNPVTVRTMKGEDFDQVIAMGKVVYPDGKPWLVEQLHSHLNVFPAGQLVAVDNQTGQILGSASSLIVLWDDYSFDTSWKDFTDNGYFTNHDPVNGRTLYGADVMVHPASQGRGIGKLIYKARRELTKELKLLRIRAGARLRNYHRSKDHLTPEDYVRKIIRGEIGDPTLSFQMKQGFRVLAVVRDYLQGDPASCGHAAVIEWINHAVATRQDTKGRDPKFGVPRKRTEKPQP